MDDEATREHLKKALHESRDVQPLTEGERAAVAAMSEVSDSRATDGDLLKLACIMASSGELYQAVANRSLAEHEALFLEVGSL